MISIAQERVTRFRDYLLFLPVSKKAVHVMFFHDNEKDITEAKNILTFIAILSRYCNYSNYEIFLHLIGRFCEDTLQKRMITYLPPLPPHNLLLETPSMSQYNCQYHAE